VLLLVGAPRWVRVHRVAGHVDVMHAVAGRHAWVHR
jgi:hypothetical protein